MLDFLKEHLGVVISTLLVIAGFFGIKKKAYKAGDKIGDVVEEKFSAKTREELGEYLERFAEGLKGEAYNGNKELISNRQIDEKLKRAKIDLGFKE